MEDLAEKEKAFAKALRAKGASENTVHTYLASLRLYFSLYSAVTVENLNSYKSYLLGHYRPSTVNSRLCGMNQYLDVFGMDEPCGEKDFRIAAVKEQHKSFTDHVISQEDYQLLKEKLKEDKNMFWYFVVHFLGSTGARISELLQIKAEHIQLGYMDLYSKGGKIRRIYFPEILCQEALAWLKSRGLDSGFVFTNRQGQPLTPRAVNMQLKSLARRYGIDPETVFPHSFRHRFAKNFLERFNDVALLADLLGHDSIETTRIYLRRSSQEQQAFIDEIVTW